MPILREEEGIPLVEDHLSERVTFLLILALGFLKLPSFGFEIIDLCSIRQNSVECANSGIIKFEPRIVLLRSLHASRQLAPSIQFSYCEEQLPDPHRFE